MIIKTLVLLLFLSTLPITLTAQGSWLVVAGVLGSFVTTLVVSGGNSFVETWSRILLILLGFGTICLVRIDPYALMLFAFFTLGIIDSKIGRRNSERADSCKDLPEKRGVKGSSPLYFEGVLTLSMFWFFIHGVFSATTNIWSLKTLYLMLAHRSPAIFPVYGQLACVALFCAYLPLFSASPSKRSNFLQGVYAGLWCAIPLVLLQLAGVPLPYVPVEAPFWEFSNRHSGMFEDPNSFGVVIGLVLFIGAQQRWYLLSFCWILLAFYSGSRLFTLSLVILLLVFVVRIVRHDIIQWKIGSSATLRTGIIFCLIVAIFGLTAFFCLNRFDVLPAAFYRGVSPLNVARLAETFSTRTAFWNIALQIFAQNSLAGVGFGNFDRVMTSYARRSGNDLNLWTDTPNNLYFGLLAELGIIGFLIFIFEVRKISWTRSAEPGIFLKAGVLVFLLMLFFGTHIYFVECSLIGAFILGCCVTERGEKKWPAGTASWLYRGTLIVGIVALLFGVHRSMEYGWYPWERDIDGSYTRWSVPRAQSLQRCKDDRVTFEIVLPPQRIVEIRSPFDVMNLMTTPSRWQEVSMDCNGAVRLPLSFKVSKGWIPAVDSPETNEWRTLGVRLKADPADMAAPLNIMR